MRQYSACHFLYARYQSLVSFGGFVFLRSLFLPIYPLFAHPGGDALVHALVGRQKQA